MGILTESFYKILDIIASGLNVARGLPLFVDVTVLSPVSRSGQPRPGTSNRGGRLLEAADADNQMTYAPVVESGLGALYSLGCEVFGRWSTSCIGLMTELVRERSRMLHPRSEEVLHWGFNADGGASCQ